METCALCSFAPLAFPACVRMKTNIFTVVFMTLLVRPIPFPDLSISTGAHSRLSLPVHRPPCCSSSTRGRPASCGLCTSVLCCFSLDVRGCVPQLLQVYWNATAEVLLYQLAFLFFHLIFILYWSIVDLQCCVTFRCTAKWFSYTYTYIPSFLRFFSHIGHYRVLSRVHCAIQ